MEPIETKPLADAISAYANDPASGIGAEQRDMLLALVRNVAGQTHVTAAGLAHEWENTYCERGMMRSVKAQTLTDALSATTPAEFAREASRLFDGDSAASARPDSLPRIAAALELYVLKNAAGSYSNEAYVTACTDAIKRVIRNATEAT